MMRVAVCDDDLQLLEQMRSVIGETFAERGLQCTLFVFSSGETLLEAHRAQPFDILFLDILLPERSGFEIARDVRGISDKTLLLFVTSQDALVYDSFSYHPFYFLRKGDGSVFAQSLRETVEKIIGYLLRNEMVTLDLGVGEYRTVCAGDILYLKSGMHFLDYRLKNGDSIRVRQTMTDAEEKMRRYGFMRVHKTVLVSISHVRKLDTSRYPKVILDNGESLPFGRKYKETACQKYMERMRELI